MAIPSISEGNLLKVAVPLASCLLVLACVGGGAAQLRPDGRSADIIVGYVQLLHATKLDLRANANETGPMLSRPMRYRGFFRRWFETRTHVILIAVPDPSETTSCDAPGEEQELTVARVPKRLLDARKLPQRTYETLELELTGTLWKQSGAPPTWIRTRGWEHEIREIRDVVVTGLRCEPIVSTG